MCAASGPDVVAPGPEGTRFAAVHRFGEIDSTNRYLLDAARAGAPEGTVAVADYQRAGRGRLGRRWEAPAGSNLLVSVLLRPVLPADELHLCTTAVALAAADACAAAAGLAPGLKWPNDLVVGERKLAGVLAEAAPSAPTTGAPGVRPAGGGGPAAGQVVVVGLGLNVGWPPPGDGGSRLPGPPEPGASDLEEVLRTATSIRRETGAAVTPSDLLDAVLVALEPRLDDLGDTAGRARLAEEYRRRCVTLGRAVRVSCAGETFTGTASDVTGAGHLVVEVGRGVRTVAAGDVVHLRHSA